MKKITVLLLFALSFGTFAQNVNIPDANFKAYLVGNTAINTNNDTNIQVSEAEAFSGEMRIGSKEITNLIGIKSFVNLRKLYCSFNSLTSLDIEGLTKLTHLDCLSNQLTSLNVEGCSSLKSLYCKSNYLKQLNVSTLINLEQLLCYDNQLETLNVTPLIELQELWCQDNRLKALDVSALLTLDELYCKNNLLKTICLDPTHKTNGWTKDASAEWSTNCKPLAFLETESTEKVKIINAFNLHGQKVPVDTKGEIIILLYDNGVREKTYVAE